MKFTILISLLITSSLFAQSYNSGQPAEWKDLIGKKYSGSDKDLAEFKITSPEIRCDSISQKCAVTWDNSRERSSPTNKNQIEQLTSYEIFFQVNDRKGKEILNKSYKWDINVTSKKDGYVYPYDRIVQWGEIKLDYSTVNYWVQNIKWKILPPKKAQKYDGLKAFTIKDQLEASQKQKERD